MFAYNWQKSSYSASGNACLEVTSTWQKSSHSAQGSNCLEIGAATATPCVHLRESYDPGIVLNTSPAQLDALLRVTKSGSLRGISKSER